MSMGGISLFGTKTKQLAKNEPKIEAKSAYKTEIEELEKLKKEMTEFLKAKENSFTQQKKELVELVENTIKNKEQMLSDSINSKLNDREKIFDGIIERSIKQNLEKQKETIQGTYQYIPPPQIQQPLPLPVQAIEKPEPIKKEPKNRYYKATDTLITTLVENFPDASVIKRDEIYLGSVDNQYYHKKGAKYNLLNQAYLCKCNATTK